MRSTRFFTCSGSAVSESAGEADDVGHEHGDEAALVGTGGKRVPAFGAEPGGLGHALTTGRAAHGAQVTGAESRPRSSQRLPSGSAKRQTRPPHSVACGSATIVAPARASGLARARRPRRGRRGARRARCPRNAAGWRERGIGQAAREVFERIEREARAVGLEQHHAGRRVAAPRPSEPLVEVGGRGEVAHAQRHEPDARPGSRVSGLGIGPCGAGPTRRCRSSARRST